MKKILFLIVALSATLNMNAQRPRLTANLGATTPVVQADEPTTAQEWHNKLGQTIMTVEANLSKLSDSDAKTQLSQAYSEANELYLADYDSEKSEEYKYAYNTLFAAYQAAIKVDVDVQVSALGSAIDNAETTKDEVLVGTDYQAQLLGYINAATIVKETYSYPNKTEFAIGDISYLNGYITNFNTNVQDVINNDIANERDMLNVTIGIAETRLLGIEGESSIIAAALDEAITTAKVAAGDLTLTAHRLSEEHTAIYTVDQGCKDNFELFKTAKLELYNTIKAANSFCVTIKHNPISIFLYQSITTAQGVYDGAINKTTDDLGAEKGKLEDVQTAAIKAEAVAVEIDVWIANAMHALLSIEDEDIRGQINDAIDEAKEALKTKSAKNDLDDALTTLQGNTQAYINADITKACEDLKEQIDDADAKLTNVIAYDEFKSDLKGKRDLADGVYRTNHIAKEIDEATETLRSAISEIVDNDGQKAANELNSKLEDANSKLQEVNGENITLAGDLETKISEAQSLVSEGTARARKAAADDLTLAIQAAENAYNMFDANKTALEAETSDARETLSTISYDDHPAIHTALSDAIRTADGVLAEETIKIKTNAEISQAVVALKNAHKGAKDAEVQALLLDGVISDAKTALNTIVDGGAKSGLQTAINKANELFGESSKSTDYFDARNNLYRAMTAYVEDDIEQGRIALGKAIDSADKAWRDTLVNEPYLTYVNDAITTAGNVKGNETADRVTLDGATRDLLSAVRDAVVGDLVAENEILDNAVSAAQSALALYGNISDNIKNTTAKKDFKAAVVTPFSNIIAKANTVLGAETSTSKQMDEQVTNLTDGESVMETDYNNLYESEKQNFVTSYLKEKNLIAKIKNENDVIVSNKSSKYMQAAIELNEKMNGEHPTECTYDEIINVRINVDTECGTLQKEFDNWSQYGFDLYNLIDHAGLVKAGFVEVEGGTIGETLQTAIDNADDIYQIRRNKTASNLKTAISNLQQAIESANNAYSTQYWDFTDTKSDIKVNNVDEKTGMYEAGHARYSRTIAAEGNFGTFVLPMEIIVDEQFKHVYRFEQFAIHNNDGVLKLFLTEIAQGQKIAAGTVFFAQLAKEGKLVLKNNSALNFKINDAGKLINTETSKEIKPGSTSIAVFEQTGNSSFLEKLSVKYSWTGTFKQVTDLTKKFVYKNAASKFLAPDDYIDPFRGYLLQIGDFPSTAKSVEAIEFDFGDGSETTGIRSIMMGSSDGSQIFSIDGKNMGNDMNSLNKGVYIINGKKVLK